MGNVIRFPGDITKPEWLNQLYHELCVGEKVAVAIKNANEEVITAYYNTNPIEKQELVSHMQIDVIRDMFLATYDMQERED